MTSDTYLIFLPDPEDASWGPNWTPRVAGDQPRELAALRQSAFLWYNFRASSEFKVGGANFGIVSPPFCVVDHALMLSAARDIIQRDGSAVLDLSDRPGQWHFSNADGQVKIRTTGFDHRSEGLCATDIFERLVDQALVDALALIFNAQPSLRENSYLRGLAETAAGTGLAPSSWVD
jgi:hypothetical protein